MNSIISCLLIANRGEIALRIIQTCRKLGIKSAVVYTAADANLPFVRAADSAILLKGIQVSETYLDTEQILNAAKAVAADAIHPGYGFLSENASFAKAVEGNGLIWVGPHADAIEAMGLKSNAKKIAAENNVPIIPGYNGDNQNPEFLYSKALELGFPLLLKASAGGGGKGMRIVYEAQFLKDAIISAAREAERNFGDARLLIEKYFPSARHIEVQILADKHGNSIHLLERECTIQRRYQKIIEESPSPALSPEKRTEICDSALKLCRAISYDNAGNVEFIFNPDGSYFFLEVNTRLQVEHPITEAVSGIDLVEWQIKIAEGQKLSLNQDDIKHKAYAIECRIYAENPLNNFLPATGKILDFYIPDAMDVRVDSAVETGTEIGIYYDPMIAKIIVSAENRAAAIKKMKYALKNFRCQGLETNQHFLIQLLSNPHFYNGDYDTHFIEKHFAVEEALKISSDTKRSAASALLLYRWYLRNQNRKHINITSGWRNNFYKMQQEIFDCDNEIFQLEYDFKSNTAFEIKFDDKFYQLDLIYCKKNEIRISIDGMQCSYFIASDANIYYVQCFDAPSLAIRLKDRLPAPERERLKGSYQASMPGEILKILVSPNQEVKEGTALLILVSMKMENVVSAAEDGIVEEIYVSEAETVEAGKLLIKINSDFS